MLTRKARILLTASALLTLPVAGAQAVTISGWNLDNVGEPTELNADGTGFSYVYEDDGVTSSGRIAFTPPEAEAPGIKVSEDDDPQSDGGITLEGCLMTSNPYEGCDGGFQSGKRIKQQMTGLGPVDLVFDLDFDDANHVDDDDNPDAVNVPTVYQVYHRLINLTQQALDGFTIQLGFGVGDDFVAADLDDGLSFAQEFQAQPRDSGAASTQFPFGLFGDATSNPNFTLDGFFAAERTGFDVALNDLDPGEAIVATELSSLGLFGPYATLFGNWLSQEAVPLGVFWDHDLNPGTDALLMAWQSDDETWEIRREVLELASLDEGEVIPGVAGTIEAWKVGVTDGTGDLPGADNVFAYLWDLISGPEGGLEDFADLFFVDFIEDLANLNVNFGIRLDHDLLLASAGAFGNTFTIRTIVAPIPLPAGAPLLIGALGALALLRRRARLAA